MAMSSLRSMVRVAMRAGTFSSSPGVYGSRNALFNNVHGRSILDVARSAFVGTRGTHSRARAQLRRRRSSLPQQGVSRLGVEEGSTSFTRFEEEHADRRFAFMIVATSTAFAGVCYSMKHANKQQQQPPPAVIKDEDLTILQDPAMKTDDACLRTMQFGEDLYNKKAMVVEDDDDDAAMRARFADWMKKYGRTYRDKEEKARRFELFKAFASKVDAYNAEAAESGSSVRCGLNDFADWTTQEFARMFGELP